VPLPVELDPGRTPSLTDWSAPRDGISWTPSIPRSPRSLPTLPAPEARQRSFSRDTFGMTVRTHEDDWLIIWESEPNAIAVRYIGPDPFA
jgi:hypothetical protein